MIDNNANVLKTFNDYQEEQEVLFVKLSIFEDHPWEGHLLCEVEIEPGALVIMIRRNKKIVVPNGNTRILENDICVLNLVLT